MRILITNLSAALAKSLAEDNPGIPSFRLSHTAAQALALRQSTGVSRKARRAFTTPEVRAMLKRSTPELERLAQNTAPPALAPAQAAKKDWQVPGKVSYSRAQDGLKDVAGVHAMKLYHGDTKGGSRSGGESTADIPGFYLTPQREYAQRFTGMFATQMGGKVHSYRLDPAARVATSDSVENHPDFTEAEQNALGEENADWSEDAHFKRVVDFAQAHGVHALYREDADGSSPMKGDKADETRTVHDPEVIMLDKSKMIRYPDREAFTKPVGSALWVKPAMAKGVFKAIISREWLRAQVRDHKERVAAANAQANPSPTPAQCEAGNYQAGHVRLHGLDITIETPAGAERTGTAGNGTAWSVRLKYPYGYVKGTSHAAGPSADGDSIDVIIGPHPHSELVYVVDQTDARGAFDEHKCILGATSEPEARGVYLSNYSPGWKGLGGITSMTVQEFRVWLKAGQKQAITPRLMPPLLVKATEHRIPAGRPGGGRWTDGMESGPVPLSIPSPSAKSMLAKQSAVYVGADIQRYSEEHNEPILAAGIHGVSLRDNEPVDVVVLRKGKVAHGVELKTMVSNSNNKITMKSSAMQRKTAWMQEHGAPYHTVVFDDHAVFNASGQGLHDESKRQIYYKRGFGSFRVGSMHPVKDMSELNALMDTPDAGLPADAKPPKGYISHGRR